MPAAAVIRRAPKTTPPVGFWGRALYNQNLLLFMQGKICIPDNPFIVKLRTKLILFS